MDILEDKIPLQLKLEFKKEEAELHKLLAKKIPHAKKEHDEAKRDRKARHHAKSESHHNVFGESQNLTQYNPTAPYIHWPAYV
eukprot:2323348-Ditylum_brightwellii.AAC.1